HSSERRGLRGHCERVREGDWSAVMTKSGLRLSCFVAFAIGALGIVAAQSRHLDIYWIDVEGGAATLVVSPSGESLLYDAGWEVDGRDAKRIVAAAQQAGLKKIDYFVLSHFHA